MERIEILTDDGVRLHVALDGAPGKPPLLLSNSLGTDLELWTDQVRPLSEDFRLVRYDTRGHGRSAVPDAQAEWSIERLGRDVLQIAAALELPRFDFCGLSLGGMTGLWLAIHAGGNLEHLVVANAAAYAGGPAMWLERAGLVQRGGMAPLVEPTISRWFTPNFLETHAAVVETIRRSLASMNTAGYSGCATAIGHLDLRSGLSGIATPTLLIGGSQDGGPSPAVLEGMAKIIPEAQLRLLPAAHLSNVEAPAAFTAAVREFLR